MQKALAQNARRPEAHVRTATDPQLPSCSKQKTIQSLISFERVKAAGHSEKGADCTRSTVRLVTEWSVTARYDRFAARSYPS